MNKITIEKIGKELVISIFKDDYNIPEESINKIINFYSYNSYYQINH